MRSRRAPSNPLSFSLYITFSLPLLPDAQVDPTQVQARHNSGNFGSCCSIKSEAYSRSSRFRHPRSSIRDSLSHAAECTFSDQLMSCQFERSRGMSQTDDLIRQIPFCAMRWQCTAPSRAISQYTQEDKGARIHAHGSPECGMELDSEVAVVVEYKVVYLAELFSLPGVRSIRRGNGAEC